MSGLVAPNSNPDVARILLVDDEARNLEALESLLDSSDYSVVRALTAEAALRALLEQDFAAILMDVRMPTISGIELAVLIKQRKRSQGIPIIFLTANAPDQADALRGYEAGAVDYLTKPIDSKILKTKIAVFVDLFKKKNELIRAEESLRQANAELERRVLERTETLTQAHKELVAASRAKDDFLAALSHELRTPLNPVLLIASDAAEDPNLSPEVRAKFSTICSNVELEARLIDDLLDITRISHGKLLLDLEPVNIHTILKKAIEMVHSDFLEKQIELTLQLNGNHTWIRADAVRLQQVFWNILKNAVKFTPAHGRVSVTTENSKVDDNIVVRITDTGIGLTPSELNSIFNAFSQGDHASQRDSHRFGGLGLGLTISRMLMELHSGQLQAASQGRGCGSTFSIELPSLPMPLDAESDVPVPVSNVELSSSPAAGIRILLVEDHEPTRVSLTQLLSRRKHAVLPAITLDEARDIASREKLDLVISDIGLPDGDGYTLMAELKRNFGLKGIALSGYGMEQDIVRSKNAGFVGHLIKPVRIERLDEVLRDIR